MEPICHIPWTWLEIDIDKKIIRNCCKTAWYPDYELKLFNHDDIIKRRKEFLLGEKSKDCTHCWRLEKEGQLSYRQFTKNNPYLQTTEFNIHTDVPVTLTINLGSLCNMSCSYCNEEYSTVWAVEKKIPISINIDNHFEEKILSWLETIISNDKLKHLILIGGEPTINPSFYRLLEMLSKFSLYRSSLLKITVQTNGMFDSKHRTKILKYSKIPNCKFTYRFSIDGTGKRAEFIRKGLDWEYFKENLESLMNSESKVAIHPTLSILSIGGLDEFLNWVSSYNYQWEDLGQNHIEDPEGLSLRSLGFHSKELLPRFSFYKDSKIQEYVIRTTMFVNKFNQTPNYKLIENCIKYHESRSKISINEAAPELANLLDKYNIGD